MHNNGYDNDRWRNRNNNDIVSVDYIYMVLFNVLATLYATFPTYIIQGNINVMMIANAVL